MVSQETECYLRFILLLLQGGTEVLRGLAEKAFRASNTTLGSLLSSNRNKIQRSKDLTKTQKNILYPQIPQNHCVIGDLDITLLSYLLNTFLKSSLDKAEQDATNEIRKMRNEVFAHATKAAIDVNTYTKWWTKLVRVVSSRSKDLPGESHTKLIKLIDEVENDPLATPDMIEQLKKLGHNESSEILMKILDDIDKRQKDTFAIVEEQNVLLKEQSVVLKQHSAVMEGIKTQLSTMRSMGKFTKSVPVHVSATLWLCSDDHNVLQDAEKMVLEGFKNSIKKSPNKPPITAVQEATDAVVKEIEQCGIKIESASHGSIVLEFICNSLTSLLELIEYFDSSSFRDRLDRISQILADHAGKRVFVYGNLDSQSFKDAISTLLTQEEKHKTAVMVDMTCTSVDGLLHTIELFEGEKAADSLEQLSQALSTSLGKPVTLHSSIDEEQFKSIITTKREELEEQKHKTAVMVDMTCTSVDGLLHTIEFFEGEKAADSLEQLSQALSTSLGKPVTLHSSIDEEQFKSIITTKREELEMEKLGFLSTKEQTPEEVKLLTRVTKQYARLKREMDMTSAKSIADYLHKNKLITAEQHNLISSGEKRGQTNEMLLQTVLHGKHKVREEFENALYVEVARNKKCSKVLKELTQRDDFISDIDIKEFKTINYAEPGAFSSIPKKICKNYITWVESYRLDALAFERITDYLLSHFCISICEHEYIIRRPFNVEERVTKLKKLLKHRPEYVYDILSTNMEVHSTEQDSGVSTKTVPEQSSSKRERQESESESEYEPTAKRRRTEEAFCKIVLSAPTIKRQADIIGFGLVEAQRGSIIISLKPKRDDSWDKLQEKCKNNSIISFIPAVYCTEDMIDGEYKIDFQIRKKELGEDPPIVEFHFRTEEDDTDESNFDVNLYLLKEELEITDELLDWLFKHNIIDSRIDEMIQDIDEREKRILFLLHEIKKCGEKGYQNLKRFIKEKNSMLYEDMIRNEKILLLEKQSDDPPSVSSRTRSKTGTLYYSASIILQVKRESGDQMKKKKKDAVTVKVLSILSTKCHFETGQDSTRGLNTGSKSIKLKSFVSKSVEKTKKSIRYVGYPLMVFFFKPYITIVDILSICVCFVLVYLLLFLV